MEFVKLFNDSVRNMRMITLMALAAVVLSNVFWYFTYDKKLTELTQKVYVATDNGTMAALTASHNLPTIYEARNLVQNFMQLMFSQDAESFKQRVNLGLKLIDRQSGLALYETFKQGKVLENLHRYNSRTQFLIDSIQVDMRAEPYQGVVYGAQQVYYQKEIALQPIAAKFQLLKQYRNNDNPYGLLIENFTFIRYERSQAE